MTLGEVKSILLVEDDPDDQELFELALTEVAQTIKLTKAMDGIDALNQLSATTERPDLIVFDINMPRMNGHEFLLALKKQDNLKNIRVVLYSTSSESHYVKEIMDAGASSFFKKPDNYKGLCNEVKALTKLN